MADARKAPAGAVVAQPTKAPTGEPVKAIAVVRREGKHVVLELTIAGGSVVQTRQVAAEYYRDIAEDAALRWLRRGGK